MTGRAGAIVAALVLAVCAAAVVAVVFVSTDETFPPADDPERQVELSPESPPPSGAVVPGAVPESQGTPLTGNRRSSGSPGDAAERLSCIEDIFLRHSRTGYVNWLGSSRGWAQFEELERSTDPDHVLAAMHLAYRNPERFWALYERAELLVPDDGRRAFLGALRCAAPDSGDCPPDFFTRLLDREQANGALWLLAANHAAALDDYDKAREYLDVAISLGVYSDHLVESVDAVYKSLAVVTTRSHVELIAAGLAVATDPLSTVGGEIVTTCGSEAAASPARAAQCERLGRSLMKQPQSLVLYELGNRIVGTVAGQSEGEKRAELEALHRESREWLFELMEPMESTAQLMVVDESLFARFLELNRQHGFHDALSTYFEEAEQRIADPDYRPCDNLAPVR